MHCVTLNSSTSLPVQTFMAVLVFCDRGGKGASDRLSRSPDWGRGQLSGSGELPVIVEGYANVTLLKGFAHVGLDTTCARVQIIYYP